MLQKHEISKGIFIDTFWIYTDLNSRDFTLHKKSDVYHKNYDSDRNYFGKCDYGRGHDSLFKDYYDCLASGEKFWINGEEGAKVIRLILAVYESNGKRLIYEISKQNEQRELH